MSAETLSKRQADALRIIKRAIRRYSMPPTRAELGEAMGVSAQTAHFHLQALERKGYIRMGDGARNIFELGDNSLPLLGQVAAGMPTLAIEDLLDLLPVPSNIEADFALRVSGDSMIESGVLDGDVVYLQQVPVAESGDMVVALIGEGEQCEATLKYFLPYDGRIVLRPANQDYSDIIVSDGDNFALVGKVVGLHRSF
ncbi:MAG: transcriptional repressor LexA [Planctomycetota bacterium]|nr:transcriptional repressor LexA [Planctomycetota bacterium]